MIVGNPEDISGTTGSNSHGGTGKYFVRTLLEGTPAQSFKYVRDLTLHAGSSIGLHPHDNDEEIYFVIEGEGVMIVDEEEMRLGPGAVCLTPAGHSHGLRNDGDKDLRIFVACAECAECGT